MVLGTALLVLTLAGHTAASTLPTTPAIAITAVPAFAIAWAIGDRRRSLPLLICTLLAAQALLHTVLSLVGSGGHAEHGLHLVPTTQMLTFHVVAGIVAALVFAYGETCAARWLTYFGHVLGAPVLPTTAVASINAPIGTAPDLSRTQRALAHHVVRRGPPAFAA